MAEGFLGEANKQCEPGAAAIAVSHAEGQHVLLLPQPGGTNPAPSLALLCHQTFQLYTNHQLSFVTKPSSYIQIVN